MHVLLSPLHLFPSAIGLVFVGGVVNTGPNNTAATYDQSLSGTLTGGIDSSPSEGDVVVVASFVGRGTDRDMGCSGDVSGAYTEHADLFSNDLRDTNLGVYTKIMGATPDTKVTLTGTDNTPAITAACAIHVWRNNDPGTVLDVAVETATGINSGNAAPPSVTPVTERAVVLAIGASCDNYDSATSHTTSAGYINTFYALSDATASVEHRIRGGIQSKVWSGSGAESPAAWSISDSDADCSWAACTLVLRPAD